MIFACKIHCTFNQEIKKYNHETILFYTYFFLLVSCRKENHFIPDNLKNQFHQKNIINHQSFKELFNSFSRNLILIKGASIEQSEIVKNQIKFQLSKSIAIFLLQKSKISNTY